MQRNAIAPKRRTHTERELPSPWWGVLILLGLVGLLVLAGYGGYWAWMRTNPAEVTVPKLKGRQRVDAESALRRLGLVPRISGERHSETFGEDVVIESRPKADRVVKQGRAVDLLISLGSAYTHVPNLEKMPFAEAQDALRDADLVVAKRSDYYHSTIPVGSVISQQPGPKTRVPRGSGVQLRVSLGPAPQSEPSSAAVNGTESVAEPRYVRVEAVTPSDGREHRVRIEVWDEGGERTAYDHTRGPGETVERYVRGVGLITIQVFVDDDIVEQKTL
jgi:beta-lactam-binding protein with PASTA domain